MTYAEKKAWIRENITLFATLLFPGARIVHAHAMLGRCKTKCWTKLYSWCPGPHAAPVCEECAAHPPGLHTVGLDVCKACAFVRDEIWPNLGEAGRVSFWEFLAFRAEPAGSHSSAGEARPPEHWD
jgi:hypothetical protein